MATMIGKGHIYSLGSATLNPNIAGYVSPNMQSLRLTHVGEPERGIGQTGAITSVLHKDDDYLECEFNVVCEGSSITNARESARIPARGQSFAITGLPVISVGTSSASGTTNSHSFRDAFNTNGANTQPWFYEGGGVLSGSMDGKMTLVMTLRRYPAITSATPISA